MIDETFVNAIEGLTKESVEPKCIEINGEHYSNIPLVKQPEPVIEKLHVQTLGAVVSFCKMIGERIRDMFIHVQSPRSVSLCYRDVNNNAIRPILLISEPPSVDIGVGEWMSLQSMIINLRTNYVSDDSTKKLIDLCSKVTAVSSVVSDDNGLQQEVTTKKGISLKEKISPDPVVALRPFRTFAEVDQPKCFFLLRFEERGNNSVSCCLFGADGEGWQVVAVNKIKEFFKKELPSATIIA